ncbi:hypothetical protein EYF80_021052 [Liparis tanakae]|uniref:Uncharacterized protein n=1 Tax=Liparis tanakae TaxID=230148 RepID=A0A4Z2HSV8_9TELE|nr:hypothetical protein EYF80_021052 [Liparis tanakae]
MSQLNDWSGEDGALTTCQLARARDVLVHAVQRKDCPRCTLRLPQVHTQTAPGAPSDCPRCTQTAPGAHSDCPRCILGLPQVHPQTAPGAHSDCPRCILGLPQVHTRTAPGAYSDCPRCTLRLPQVHTQTAPGAYSECPRCTLGLPQVHTQNAPGAHSDCPRCTLGLPQVIYFLFIWIMEIVGNGQEVGLGVNVAEKSLTPLPPRRSPTTPTYTSGPTLQPPSSPFFDVISLTVVAPRCPDRFERHAVDRSSNVTRECSDQTQEETARVFCFAVIAEKVLKDGTEEVRFSPTE